MKKFRSVLAIVLILTCLLSVLISCKKDSAPIEEESTTVTEAPSNISSQITQKEKENIFDRAMNLLKNNIFEDAYELLLSISDYETAAGHKVSDYLKRFSYLPANCELNVPEQEGYLYLYTYFRDKYGNLVQHRRTDSASKHYDLNYTYDERGKLIDHICNADNNVLDPLTGESSTTSLSKERYIYDESTGLLLRTEEYNTSDYVITFEYDDQNRLKKESRLNKNTTEPIVTEYFYNAQNLVSKKTITDPTATGPVDFLYTYDSEGRVLTEIGVDGAGAYTKISTYNAQGLIAKEVLKHSDTELSMLLDSVCEYTYNDRGFLDTKTEKKIIMEKPDAESPAVQVLKDYTYRYVNYTCYYNPYA